MLLIRCKSFPHSTTMESSDKTCKQPKKLEKSEKELIQLKSSLPKELWFNGSPMYLYQGFWAPRFDALIAFQNHFKAQVTDIFITSCRKAGTTWLKALIFAICNRGNSLTTSQSPLLDHNPHELVPQLESNIYRNSTCPDLSSLKSPRLFGTHLPYASLPTSIKVSSCKIIYIFRNPLDTLVSSFLYYQKVSDNQTLKPDMLGLYVDMFCEGKIPFGPFDDHVLGYWKQSLERPEKVLFIKYEDLKVDPRSQLKRMAEFVQCPFSAEEEATGVIGDIINLCSFQKLKQAAEPNKSTQVYPAVTNGSFFRKGVVGDWMKYLSTSMAEKVSTIMEEKFRDSGLTF